MKRAAGWLLIAAPFALVLALDASKHGFAYALAGLAVMVIMFGALVLGVKWATE